jgi:hypothetical protein
MKGTGDYMNTITTERVKAAKDKNVGIELKQGMWVGMNDTCACALSHVVMAECGITIHELAEEMRVVLLGRKVISSKLGLDEDYTYGFANAFDGARPSYTNEDNPEYMRGYADGEKVRADLRSEGLVE